VPLKSIKNSIGKTKRWDHRKRMRLDGSLINEPILAEIEVSLIGLRRANQAATRKRMRERRESSAKMGGLPHDEQEEDPALKMRSRGSAMRATPFRKAAQQFHKQATMCRVPRESLNWANELFARLWPKIAMHVKIKMEDPFGALTQNIQAKVPGFLKHIRFSRFDLGSKPPVFGPIMVSAAPPRVGQEDMQGIELRLFVRLESDAAITLTALKLSVGVRQLRLCGDLVVRLEPLLPEPPICGGLVVCFLDQPRIHMDFVKLARIVDNSLLAGTVKNSIDHAVAGALVMPNVAAVSLGREDQGVDRALLRTPKPLGVLRVTALRTHLPLGNSSRSIRLTLADAEWRCAVHFKTHESIWQQEEVHDFLFFDWRQKLGIEVIERSAMRLSTVLAVAEPVTLADALQIWHDENGIPLYPPGNGPVIEPHEATSSSATSVNSGTPLDQQQEQGSDVGETRAVTNNTEIVQCGRLFLRFVWLLPQVASRGIDEWCIVRVKTDEVYVPSEFGEEGARLRAKIGLVEKATPNVEYKPPRRPATDADTPPVVESVESGGKHTVELAIEFILYLLVRIAEIDSGLLELRLVSRRGTEIGAASIQLREVASSPHLTREWGGDSGRPQLKMPGSHLVSEAMVSVSVRGLEPADVSMLDDPLAFSPEE